MVNVTLFWLFLIPFIAGLLATWYIYQGTKSWERSATGALGGFVVGCLIITGMFVLGRGSKTADTEIINGSVISTSKVKDTYEQPYDCNCRTSRDSQGRETRTCDTCYETHYTVTWGCHTTVDDYTIEHLDRTSRSVYMTPDPQRWLSIRKGDPVATTHHYVNYIKAVPDSLFTPVSESLRKQYEKMIPNYPIDIYDFYRLDRVFAVGLSVPDIAEWNQKLSITLATLGPAKQANIVVILTGVTDEGYYYALQDAWKNGKKNDIIIVISAPDFPNKANWVRIMALADDEIFQVKMRDDILALDSLTADSVIGAINDEVSATFKRKHMRDFKYLDAEIDPPTWMIVLGIIFALGLQWLIASIVISTYESYNPHREY